MYANVEPAEVEMARGDLEARTLAEIPGDFARLIYLSSTRDYNDGRYHHAGLARKFSDHIAALALASCHRDVFHRLLLLPVGQLVGQIEAYLQSTHLPVTHVVQAWARLRPYRVAVPLGCSALASRFFEANVMAALAILQSRQKRAGVSHPQSALQPL